MTVQERIRKSRLLEEMKSHKDTVKALGLKDVSTFKKAPIKVNKPEFYSMKWSSSGRIEFNYDNLIWTITGRRPDKFMISPSKYLLSKFISAESPNEYPLRISGVKSNNGVIQ